MIETQLSTVSIELVCNVAFNADNTGLTYLSQPTAPPIAPTTGGNQKRRDPSLSMHNCYSTIAPGVFPLSATFPTSSFYSIPDICPSFPATEGIDEVRHEVSDNSRDLRLGRVYSITGAPFEKK
jgi:hypothetical protein